MSREIRKRLSANDLGLTGGHQAGILIPKRPEILSFFPSLDGGTKNPRSSIVVRESLGGGRWEFNFIYYNGKLFDGTRNEFRLTCMTEYLRSVNAKVGDEVVFKLDANCSYEVDLLRADPVVQGKSDVDVLVLAGGWKIVNRK